MSMATVLRCVLTLCFLCVDARAGYTHYFTWLQPPDAAPLRDCVEEMRRIMAARVSILAGPGGESSPLGGMLPMGFNGIQRQGPRPFFFPGTGRPISGGRSPPALHFCST